MKKIAEQKLQAYTTGAVGTRTLSKREQEELRKREEEEAAAHAFKEFVETFQEAPSSTSKVWVKAGTYDAGARREDTTERGKLYKPVSRLDERRNDTRPDTRPDVRPDTRIDTRAESRSELRKKNKLKDDKKKSNLELFKEELRQMQEERTERHKYKNVLRGGDAGGPAGLTTMEMLDADGSYDNGDPNTTNLYLGNLNPKITEQQLMELFGQHGPLASIKIMWPRSDEEKARGRNCGFVAFMSRRDGERALATINGTEVMGYEMKLGWGKAVLIPPVPIYIPPALQLPIKPPPPSGLPFNAQPPPHKNIRIRELESYPSDPERRQQFDELLSQSIVKVVMPQERNIVMLIHRMVEFVIREGPMFEAIIMNKEINNPFFRFLFENRSPAHAYYRWRLFSMLQGDGVRKWRTNDFRMFRGGAVWRPPCENLYTRGMPEHLVVCGPPPAARDRVLRALRRVSPARPRVARAMLAAVRLARAHHAPHAAALLAAVLHRPDTPPARRLARLYVLSDAAHNSPALRLALRPLVVSAVRAVVGGAPKCPRAASAYRRAVSRVVAAWTERALFPTEVTTAVRGVLVSLSPAPPSPASSGGECGQWDGALDGAALRRLAGHHDDIDGDPLEEDIDGSPLQEDVPEEAEGGVGEARGEAGGGTTPPAFLASRWERVEPAQVVAGAVSSREVEAGEVPEPEAGAEAGAGAGAEVGAGAGSGSGAGVRETEVLPREVVREVEVRVLRYADELEAGARSLRHGLSHTQQVQHYRNKLLRRARAKIQAEEAERVADVSPSSSNKKSKRSRDVSPPPSPPSPPRRRHRSRSRSPERGRSVSARRRRSPSPPPPPPPHPHPHHRRHKRHKY